MADRIRLVTGDTLPLLNVALFDERNGAPIDVSNAADVVRLYMRPDGDVGVPSATVTGTKPNGGADGAVSFHFGAGDLGESGYYEGEIEVEFATGDKQTVFEKLLLEVRDAIG